MMRTMMMMAWENGSNRTNVKNEKRRKRRSETPTKK
jgi:hypothetical protein